MQDKAIDLEKNVDNIDITLRPKKFKDFIGQESIKKNLEIIVKASAKRSEACDHVLIYGPPGLGKTTLAHIIASEMKSSIRITSGPAIERSGDLASILSNLADGDVLFIDEIHRLNRNIEEILYPAMEDYSIDIVVGKGPSANTLRLDIPRFTLVGATTRIGSISSPLRDRFGIVHRLDFYTVDEIKKIILRSARILKVEISDDSIDEIATRSRFTPRIANRILKRVRDFAEVKSDGIINLKLALRALEMMEIDKDGLDNNDRKILEVIIEKFNGGPVGINTLGAALAEEPSTLEEVNEPFLLRLGLLARTLKGRIATPKAFEKMGLPRNKLL